MVWALEEQARRRRAEEEEAANRREAARRSDEEEAARRRDAAELAEYRRRAAAAQQQPQGAHEQDTFSWTYRQFGWGSSSKIRGKLKKCLVGCKPHLLEKVSC